MKRLFKNTILVMAILALVCSCSTSKEIAYLQATHEGYNLQSSTPYEAKIKTDDQLGIMVNSKDYELAKMFNLPMVSFQSGEQTSGANRALSYHVDPQGMIVFPQLGAIKVEGMTRKALSTYIQNALISSGFINDPVVTVQFMNFRVSVLGEVARPGRVTVESDRFTLLDALGACGDLTIHGRRNNVKVIRENKGVKTVGEIDLRDAVQLMNSPYYYLQQNDVVYVEPNNARAAQSRMNQNRSVGTLASVVSVILSVITLATR